MAKRDCAYGIVRTATATATGTPVIFPMNESSKITPTPKKYQRVNSITPDVAGMKGAGFDVTTEFSGAELSCREMAYFLALFFGGYSYDAGSETHTITPAQDSQYFYAVRDMESPVAGTDEAEAAIGCKVESLSIDQQSDAYAKVSMSAKACDFGSDVGFEPSLVLTEDDAPLSWESLQDGTFNIGIGTDTPAADDGRTGVKLDFTRVTNYGPVTLGNRQPTKLTQGERKIMIEAKRLFEGAQALAEYEALVASEKFGVVVTWSVGTHSLTVTIPNIEIMDAYTDETGASDDEVMATLSGTAYLADGANIAGVVAIGGATLW